MANRRTVPEENIYTVAKVNSYIRNMFVQDFMLNAIHVRGEVSNCKYHTSGHIYFTLKDKSGAIACVMFAGNRETGLTFRMQEGQQVVVSGNIDVYERDGKYQLYAKRIRPDGEGDLYARFMALKEELEEMGMFAPEYKQPIPKYLRTIGVVTASTGAAVRDIIHIARRRNPYIQIILYPAIVQGEQAAASIVNGIRALERLGVDVMIVGRGGGSIEDLWAFNEREVVQAVFDCTVPIISAVGHETDTTLTDYAADLRAPTPSAAAELAVYEQALLDERILGAADALDGRMRAVLDKKRIQTENYILRMQRGNPLHRVREQQNRLIFLEDRLSAAMEKRIEAVRHRFLLYVERLKGLSPLEKLSQGYAYVSDENGNTLRSVDQVEAGGRIHVYLQDGVAEAQVTGVQKSQ
ncbi:MAG: exodeoxyribonuclease VII large subunit [Lachnospiraceae bacterium]|nr:exodeoxyribonuclease VII large subunit [Lachnospiraceae bacterium]